MSRLTEMEAFATVVEEGGFTDAARKMGVSKSAVSKHVSALESRLGARLLSRTTRRVNPTDIGLAYYDRAVRILNDAGAADALVEALHATPAGSLQISAPRDFGTHMIAPLLGPFLHAYPDISVNLDLSDSNIDLMGEGFDLAIRIGEQKDSSLRTRKLCETEYRLVASPAYLAENGTPQTLFDLHDHQLLHSSNRPGRGDWKLTAPEGNKVLFQANGGLSVNDSQLLLQAAISGMGIACLPDYLFARPLQQGIISQVLPKQELDRLGVFVVFPPGRFTQPKTRAFIDYMVSARLSGLSLGQCNKTQRTS